MPNKQFGNATDASVVMYKRPSGYSGSIYASSSIPPAKADITNINIPGAAGCYFMWRPGV